METKKIKKELLTDNVKTILLRAESMILADRRWRNYYGNRNIEGERVAR